MGGGGAGGNIFKTSRYLIYIYDFVVDFFFIKVSYEIVNNYLDFGATQPPSSGQLRFPFLPTQGTTTRRNK